MARGTVGSSLLTVDRTVERDEQAAGVAEEPDGKQHGDGQAEGKCHPLRNAEPEYESRVEEPRGDDGGAVVDVDRPEVEARLRREDAAAVRAGVVHAETAAEEATDATLRAAEPHRPQEGLAAGGGLIHRFVAGWLGFLDQAVTEPHSIFPGLTAGTQSAGLDDGRHMWDAVSGRFADRAGRSMIEWRCCSG